MIGTIIGATYQGADEFSIENLILNYHDNESNHQTTLNEQLLNTSVIKKTATLDQGSSIKFKKETFLNKLLEISPDLYYLYDFELDEYHFLNNSLLEFFDYDTNSKKDLYKNIMNSKDYNYYTKKIIPKILAINNNEFYEFEFSVNAKHNLKLELLAKEFIYTRNEDGQAKLLLGTISDISSEHQSKEKIKQSFQRERLLNEVYHNSPIGIVYSTHDQRLFNPNKKYCELVGYTKSEIENMSWIDLTPSEYLDDELDMLSLLSPDKISIKYEKEYIHKNESRIPVEVLLIAQFDELQNTEYYIGFFQNIGLRKSIEAHQDDLLIKMNKRINELQCLRDISKLIQKENDIKNIITKMIEIIPSGWQYPSNTAVKIRYKGQDYRSSNYTNSNCKINSELIIDNIPEGFIEISYVNQKIFNNPSFFLEEEKELLNNISIIVSKKIENIISNDRIKKLNLSLTEKIIKSGNDLSQLQNRFELAKYSAEIGLWEWDIKDKKMSWDEIMYQIFDIPTNEKISIPHDLKDKILFKDQDRLLDQISNCIKTYKDFNNDFEIQTATGQKKYIHVLGHPILGTYNKPERILGLSWDITKTKKQEIELNEEQQKLEEILNSSPIAFAISTDNKLAFFNNTFQHMTGLSIGDNAEKLYKNIEDRKYLKNELKTKDQFTNFDLEIVGQNGETIHTLSYFYKTIYKGKESIKGWLIDISELKKIEYELAKARDIAVSATQAKTQFLANMSHEIRTPMNAILGYAQMLKIDDNLNQHHKESLEIINRSGEMLLSLINDILDLSKIESGIMKIEENIYDFCMMLSEIKNMFSYRISKKGINFNINIQDDFPRFLYGDKQKIKQVIANLMSNAIKFTSEGNIEIIIKYEKININDIFVSIIVKDTGIGINQNDRDKVFEYFEQGENDINKKSGSGLGMAISRQYAQIMHGDVILIMSEPNQGSEFEFSFINKISEKEPQIQDNGFGYVKSIKQNQISPQVLIIDEDKSNLTLLSTQLKNVGFKVLSTTDIRNAIQEFNLQKPDFVFLGIKAPFDNAFKFIKNIREDQFNNEIPIYLISATIFDEELSIKIKESKTNGILLKPYDIEKIFLILKENLNIEYEYFNNNPNLKRIEKQHKINKELIDKLPKLWKQNIIENIQQGDIEKIRELIDMLDNKLSELKEIFISYIDEYNYQGLLDLLEGRY